MEIAQGRRKRGESLLLTAHEKNQSKKKNVALELESNNIIWYEGMRPNNFFFCNLDEELPSISIILFEG